MPPEEARTWHDEVATYDVSFEGERIGRIHLDLHPRDGKYKHAAQFDLARGVADVQLAEGVLVCNFNRGLLEHDEVVTLFHEFGHLVHHVLAGRTEWVRFSGVATEWDFVEAPSQMLEEWAWDPEVLATFARNADGETIPADLVEAMRRANDFGKGYDARTQMFYAALSYDFHVNATDDLTARLRELMARYSVFPYLEGTHMQCHFGHLDGYSSAYYTYMWSLVIAKDMFSAFDRDDLFDPEVAGPTATRCSRRVAGATPPTSSRTSSAVPTPSTRMPPGSPNDRVTVSGPTVTVLTVHPVKSLGGVSVDEATVEAQGLRDDRRWAVVDPHGTKVTAREEHALLGLRAEPLEDGAVRLVSPGGDQLDVAAPRDAAPVAVRFSGQESARPAGAEADAWLTTRVGRPLRLVWQDAQHASSDPA